MKVSLNFLLWTTFVSEDQFHLFEELKNMGYDGVEIPVMDGDYDHYRKMKAELDRLGLMASASTFVAPDEDPMSSNPEVRAKGLAKLKDNIDKAEILGSKTLIGPVYAAHKQFELEDSIEESFKRSAALLKEACQYAAPKGVHIGVEFLNRFEIILLNCAKDSMDYCKLVDEPNIGILYDTHHAHIEEYSIQGAFDESGSFFNHLHFSESHRGILGEGLVDWEATKKAVKSLKNYGGNIVIEAFADDVEGLREGANRWRPLFGDKLDLAKKSLDFTRELIK